VPFGFVKAASAIDQRLQGAGAAAFAAGRYAGVLACAIGGIVAWIRVIEEGEAEGDLQRAYGDVKSGRGRVANILKIHSLHPLVMSAHFALYRELMFGPSELSRADRELIAVALSSVNKCHY
jgi:Carboxymuconolactone decarboxylase family